MRVRDEIKLVGHFWLPEDEENRVSGTLLITDGGDIELEIVGLLGSAKGLFGSNDDVDLINGLVEKEGYVTLLGGFYKQRNISVGGVAKSYLYIERAYLGVGFDTKEEMAFNSIRFATEGMDDWVGISGIKASFSGDGHSGQITFKAPEEVSYPLENGMCLTITFSWTLPSSGSLSEAGFSQKTYMKISSEEVVQADALISICHQVLSLIGFAGDVSVSPEDVVVTSWNVKREINGKKYDVPIKLYYRSVAYSPEPARLKRHDFLFRFPQIQENFGQVIKQWLEGYECAGPAFGLYFSTKNGAHTYIDGKFLALVQSLETLHRRKCEEKVMDDSEFVDTFNLLLESCPNDKKKWLEQRLAYANEVGLRRRLKTIMEPYKTYFGSSQKRSSLLSSIVDTRNFLTHYDISLEHKAAKGAAMLDLCYKMEALFQLHMFGSLGFSKEQIKNIHDSSYRFRQKFEGVSA